jgi:hypothetical protein
MVVLKALLISNNYGRMQAATFILFRVGSRSRAFVSEWLQLGEFSLVYRVFVSEWLFAINFEVISKDSVGCRAFIAFVRELEA